MNQFNLRYDKTNDLYHFEIKGVHFTFSKQELETVQALISLIIKE